MSGIISLHVAVELLKFTLIWALLPSAGEKHIIAHHRPLWHPGPASGEHPAQHHWSGHKSYLEKQKLNSSISGSAGSFPRATFCCTWHSSSGQSLKISDFSIRALHITPIRNRGPMNSLHIGVTCMNCNSIRSSKHWHAHSTTALRHFLLPFPSASHIILFALNLLLIKSFIVILVCNWVLLIKNKNQPVEWIWFHSESTADAVCYELSRLLSTNLITVTRGWTPRGSVQFLHTGGLQLLKVLNIFSLVLLCIWLQAVGGHYTSAN